MDISQQADYAVRAVLELAQHPEERPVAAGEIARRQNIPAPFLAKIVARLAAANIVTTRRGVNGGIRLTRPPCQTTLLAVIEAIDGPVTLNRCVYSPRDCSNSKTCALHPVWLAICADLRQQLNLIHFETLAKMASCAASLSTSDLQSVLVTDKTHGVTLS